VVTKTEVGPLKREVGRNGKIVCLLSGGIDSSTLLYWLWKNRGYEVYPLTILYGQRHSKEVEAASKVASYLGLVHLTTSLPTELFRGSSLTGKGELPEGYYTDSSMAQTVVPNRNMVLLSLAGAYAVSIGAHSVAYAAHSGDHPVYPDCRPEFIAGMGKTLELGAGLGLYTPFMNWSKTDIVKLGLQLEVPYMLTWSCYKGEERPCLRCGTCVERTEAFAQNSIMDPALTLEEWKEAFVYLEEVGR
jgi:7-cyano-7-deazaguanine synthase